MTDPRAVRLIPVPYHLGHRDIGMGAGPTRLVQAGAIDRLRRAGHDVTVTTVERAGPFVHEIGATFELNVALAEAVREAVLEHSFPLVLAGNCNSAIGILAGVDPAGVGVVWFDAHGDFNTPDTTESGFFDGMALNVLVGGSWVTVAASVPGFRPVEPGRVALLGSRDLDAGERQLLSETGMLVLDCASLQRDDGEAAFRSLDAVLSETERVYVHVDLDVLDRDSVPANQLSPPGGLQWSVLHSFLRRVGERSAVCGAALTAYDPECDRDGRAAEAGLNVIEVLAELGTQSISRRGT